MKNRRQNNKQDQCECVIQDIVLCRFEKALLRQTVYKHTNEQRLVPISEIVVTFFTKIYEEIGYYASVFEDIR